MTITEQFGVSVLCAPIAQIDRRSLSQAWYSALCRNGGGAAPQSNALKHDAVSKPARNATARHGGLTVRGRRVPRPAPERPGAKGRPETRSTELPERRAVQSPLARKIQHILLKKPPALGCVRRATFGLDAASGRVQVLVQSSRNTMRIVAICTQAARAEVARAIETSRYALAAGGINTSVQVVERP